MPALADYTINYQATGVVGSPNVDIRVYVKPNASGTFTLAHTETNAIVGTMYSYTFTGFDSHTVYQVAVESVCPDVGIQFGDIYYLVNPECQVITATSNAGTLDIDWDCFTPITGDSVVEYRIEYKNSALPGPYFVETIPIANVLAYWAANPGSYPNFSYNISTGIFPGNTYEINVYTTIEFDYYLDPFITTPTEIPIQCTIISPVVV